MKVYDILMNTPLGKKKGELKAKIENGKLSGFLSLFGNTEPIEVNRPRRRGNRYMHSKV